MADAIHKRNPARDASAKVPDSPRPSLASEVDSDHPIVVRMPVDVRRLTPTVIAALAVVLFLRYSAPVLVPIILAILISYVLNPLVNVLERAHVTRVIGA